MNNDDLKYFKDRYNNFCIYCKYRNNNWLDPPCLNCMRYTKDPIFFMPKERRNK